MDKKEITAFFDSRADLWDEGMVKSQHKISEIFDFAEISEEKTVLDVACGTGVLIPDYISRKVKKCVAVDISSKMIDVAKRKYGDYKEVEFICADAETFRFTDNFDCVMIYNAFPHFFDRNLLFDNLSKCINKNGRITVAHGMSRESLLIHHSGAAKNVSSILPEASELAEIMSSFYSVDVICSTDEIYVVSGLMK